MSKRPEWSCDMDPQRAFIKFLGPGATKDDILSSGPAFCNRRTKGCKKETMTKCMKKIQLGGKRRRRRRTKKRKSRKKRKKSRRKRRRSRRRRRR